MTFPSQHACLWAYTTWNLLQYRATLCEWDSHQCLKFCSIITILIELFYRMSVVILHSVHCRISWYWSKSVSAVNIHGMPSASFSHWCIKRSCYLWFVGWRKQTCGASTERGSPVVVGSARDDHLIAYSNRHLVPGWPQCTYCQGPTAWQSIKCTRGCHVTFTANCSGWPKCQDDFKRMKEGIDILPSLLLHSLLLKRRKKSLNKKNE